MIFSPTIGKEVWNLELEVNLLGVLDANSHL